jgi:predicted nucleic acid-binding protein
MWPAPAGLMIVINSSPAINLGRALASLAVLSELYGRVVVPFEVMREIETGANRDATAQMLRGCAGVEIRGQPAPVYPLLAHELDRGEAAVIQTALAEGIVTVVLDDLKARRAASLAGLEVTGSLGVLVLAKQVGKLRSVREAVERMRAGGAWLEDAVIQRALQLAGEV